VQRPFAEDSPVLGRTWTGTAMGLDASSLTRSNWNGPGVQAAGAGIAAGRR
jgi:hypothetical protein